MFQADRERLRTERLFHRAVVGPQIFYRRLDADGEHHHLLALAHDSAGDLAAETAKIMDGMIRRVVGTIHPLHGEAKRIQVPVARDVYRLEMREQWRTF